ncbi:MAG: cobaltochelatase subunit CobN, partial [Pusillimonas sp.]
TAPGAYSPSTQFAIRAGAQWDDVRLSQLYTDRLGHAYGENDDGAADAAGFVAQLSSVEAAVFSRSSNAYGLLDTSMPAAYLGGIGMAVREHTGRQVSNYVADLKASQTGQAHLEPLARTFGRELQSRYFNPEWIRAMQKSGYNGARYMADLPAHMLLWDVTTPQLVADADWAEIKEVYVEDKYGLDLETYFEQHNPHARQHLLETLLDAIERGSWQADDSDREQLEQVLAESVARHGSDCALPSCQATQLVKMEQPAPASSSTPAVAPPTAAAAQAEPSPATASVEGYALEPRAAAPVQPVQQGVWLWLLATVALIAGGWMRRLRW